jgi:putative membrane protein
MTSIRIAFTELERLLSSGLARLAVLAMILVPALYGGLYLYANHDPYDRLSSVPAALVVLDEGAERPSGQAFNAGGEVAEELLAGDSFDWQVVTQEEADDGVEDGTYEFALTIPADFSAALASPATFEPEQARLTMTTNDANSYISTTIADRITDSVRDALAERVGTEAASSFLTGLAEIRDDLDAATKDTRKLRDGLTDATSGARRLERSADNVADGAREAAADNGQLADAASRVRSAGAGISRQYQILRVTMLRRMVQAGLNTNQRQFLMQVYDALGGQIRSGNARLLDAASDVSALADGSDRLTNGARRVSSGADDLRAALVELRKGSAELDRGLRDGVEQIPAVGDQTRARMAETIGNPVEVRNVAQTEADSYGEGLAPFFLALAAWIGGFALFLLVRPLSTRAMSANQGPIRVAFGGWLTPALIGALQMALLGAVVFLAIDIVPEDIPLTMAFLLLASATFIAIVHCLNAWFGVAGQFLALVLLVLQLTTAGGTFPWQTIPEPLYWLHYALPMSYAVDGLRQLMYGGAPELAGFAAAVLFAWLVVAITLTAVAARRQRTWTVKRIKPELAL